ncbi:MAG: class I mannose-6-phosphate isomerase, partial [Candidatus Eremiobacteraeota bacterium]|nr:class I mannose-6-phosphate isomerase [Candidatus Eremiobacteraeota bacterium]
MLGSGAQVERRTASETAVAMLVPFAIEPREVPLIWGGRALVRRFHKPGDPNAAIGESWECWDENSARGGPYAGDTIAQLREKLRDGLVGSLDAQRPFPILTKFIDAREPLSVQVHPDDAYAQRVEHQANGKTECWVILEAEADAHLILGWTRDTSRDEYVKRVADGSLGDLLRRVPVRPGDVFYLPAGTVHSIGAGIVLYETQQTSDLTYRIFDWNRLGPDGKPRQLHVDKAADVLDYRASQSGALTPLPYRSDGLQRTVLVADHRFILERITVQKTPGTIGLNGMPLVITAMDEPILLEADRTVLVLAPYETAMVPAAAG